MTDQLTRRQLLERAALGGAAITFPGILAACGSSGTKAGGGSTTAQKKLAKTLHFSNWTLYIDNKPGGRHPSLDQFQKKYGVHVDYREDINDNASFFSKIQPDLSRGQSTGRDIIVMTDNSRYPSLLIDKGWVEKLDKSAIPNIKNLIPQQRHPSWDPNRDHSLPWQSGMTGIGWNSNLTDPVLTMDDLLGNPKLKGKAGLLSEFSDTLALVMAANGDDPSKVTDKTFDKAIKTIKKAVNSGQIRAFYGNDYSGALAKGDLVATMAWSGDIVQLQADNHGRRHLDRQHADPEGRRRVHGERVHELGLHAEDRRRDRGLRQLHLPGPRGEGGAAEAGPGDRQEHAHLPDPGDAQQRPHDRPGRPQQREVPDDLAEHGLGLTPLRLEMTSVVSTGRFRRTCEQSPHVLKTTPQAVS
jgi:spermidine/putrescine-binding protein